jgi:acyl-CoA synthetase (AMP-forming)/AMP-acid ligase II
VPVRITLSPDLSPTPILDAFEAARGSIVDLDRDAVVTADELRRRSLDLERVFIAGGLGRGDRAVVAVGNGPMFLATLSAILRAEGSPLLVHADTPAAEVARTGRQFGAAFAVTDAIALQDLESARLDGRAFSHSDWASGVWSRNPAAPGIEDLDDVLLAGVPLHPTSGTTGEPKLALRPGSAAVAEPLHYIETIGVDESDSVLCTIPMSHAYGYGMCAMVPLLSGATLLSMRRVNAGIIVKALTERGVTVYPSMPATLELLLLAVEDAPAPPRCITTAGTALPERIAAQVKSRWGATVRPLYGTTETGGIAVATPDHDPQAAGSVGPPMEGVSVRLQPDDDAPGEAGDVGQLWVSSSSMMAGYLTPAGIDASSIADGWFNTGDLARLDEAGNIVLRGRESEVINAFGNKVLPSEVEEVISLLPEVVEVKVYAAPNRWGSNSVKAAVVATGELTDAEVRAHCRKNLVPYKQPEQIALLEKLPRSPSGKILLSQLP